MKDLFSQMKGGGSFLEYSSKKYQSKKKQTRREKRDKKNFLRRNFVYSSNEELPKKKNKKKD